MRGGKMPPARRLLAPYVPFIPSPHPLVAPSHPLVALSPRRPVLSSRRPVSACPRPRVLASPSSCPRVVVPFLASPSPLGQGGDVTWVVEMVVLDVGWWSTQGWLMWGVSMWWVSTWGVDGAVIDVAASMAVVVVVVMSWRSSSRRCGGRHHRRHDKRGGGRRRRRHDMGVDNVVACRGVDDDVEVA